MRTKEKELGSFAFCALMVTLAKDKRQGAPQMQVKVLGAKAFTKHLFDGKQLTAELMSGAYAALAKQAKIQG